MIILGDCGCLLWRCLLFSPATLFNGLLFVGLYIRSIGDEVIGKRADAKQHCS